MNKIIDYQLVRISEFGLEISRLLEKGYQPYWLPFGSAGWIYQAVVRYEEETFTDQLSCEKQKLKKGQCVWVKGVVLEEENSDKNLLIEFYTSYNRNNGSLATVGASELKSRDEDN